MTHGGHISNVFNGYSMRRAGVVVRRPVPRLDRNAPSFVASGLSEPGPFV